MHFEPRATINRLNIYSMQNQCKSNSANQIKIAIEFFAFAATWECHTFVIMIHLFKVNERISWTKMYRLKNVRMATEFRRFRRNGNHSNFKDKFWTSPFFQLSNSVLTHFRLFFYNLSFVIFRFLVFISWLKNEMEKLFFSMLSLIHGFYRLSQLNYSCFLSLSLWNGNSNQIMYMRLQSNRHLPFFVLSTINHPKWIH